MAEYKMSHEELQCFVDEAIKNSAGDKKNMMLHKAEILTALTGVFDDEVVANQREQKQLLELWSNQQDDKSQLMLGKRYIRIYDGMLAFVEAFLTGGLCDAVLSTALLGNTVSGAFTVGAISSVVYAIVKVLKEAVSLEDYDLCLYMQMAAHYNEKEDFVKEEMMQWFPCDDICNQLTRKWTCSHIQSGDKCGVQENDIDDMIESLYDKKILDYRHRDNKKSYFILMRK